MSEVPAAGTPARKFMNDMAAAGVPVEHDGVRMLYDIVAVAGPFAGVPVRTGVSVNEVGNWPQIPPHWVHLPVEVTFAPGTTNTDTVDALPGWQRHSRDLGAWSLDVPAAVAWLRQVRGIVSSASEAATVLR